MAGSYPDNPSRRHAYDVDGTVVINAKTDHTGVQACTGLDQGQSEFGGTTNHLLIPARRFFYYYAFIFPELREIDGQFFAINKTNVADNLTNLETSVNTTNGLDGTWVVQIANPPNNDTNFIPGWRDNITSHALSSIKALRITSYPNEDYNGITMAHLYGTITPGETPDRILFLDTLAADAVFIKPLDFGDVPRGQTQTRTFKIKNNSSTYTINTIQVTAEDLYLNAGGWYTFGIDDVTYAATYAAGNLGTGATLLLYMKQIIPDAETLGLQTGRIRVSHASLT